MPEAQTSGAGAPRRPVRQRTDTTEPRRERPQDQAVSQRYAGLPRRDTAPETLLRRALFARGMRYRVQYPVPGLPRRKVDVAFTRWKVAVQVDGCFWHGCPDHGTSPNRNSEWWRWKIARNKARDRDTDVQLRSLGWTVIRVWEHDDPGSAAQRIDEVINDLRRGARTTHVVPRPRRPTGSPAGR